MKKIVDFNKYNAKRGCLMNPNMNIHEEPLTYEEQVTYEGLVAQLKANPASSYNESQAEDLADKVLSIDASYSQAPIPVTKIAMGFGIKTYQEASMSRDISGNIYIGGTTEQIYHTNQVIIVSDSEPYFHQRFIVAHELAHYLMDYLGNPIYESNRKLFSEEYRKKDHDSWKELRANRFAAELLMPANLFVDSYVYAMRRSGYNEYYTVAYLSNYFETKKSSIEKRIKEVIL